MLLWRHFLDMNNIYNQLALVKVKVTQSCPTLCDPMDYTVHGILQARILEWVAFLFFRGSSQPRDWTQVSGVAGGSFPTELSGKLALRKASYHPQCRWASINQFKGTGAESRFLEKEFCLQTVTENSCLSFQPAGLSYRFQTQDCNISSFLNF